MSLVDVIHCDSKSMKKFEEYSPILSGKGFSSKLKSKVQTGFVRSFLSSETWHLANESKARWK